jgi:hypothetical protein
MFKYVPLEAALIGEGEFLAQVDADLDKAQKAIVEFVNRHKEEAKDATAKVKIEITLKAGAPKDNFYTVAFVTKIELPNRPAHVTTAQGDMTQTGEPCLYVRQSGSSETLPAQGVLTTQKGEIVAPAE